LLLASLHSALNDDVPQVLERSDRRLAEVKQRADGITGPGILVKLFAVPPEDAQSGDNSKPTLWVVGSPKATKWTPRKSANAHGAKAKPTGKATGSYAANASSASKHRMRARPIRGKAVGQKEQRSPTRGKRNMVESAVQEDHSESDNTSEEQEKEEEGAAGQGDRGEDGTGEDDPGEDDTGGHDTGGHDTGEDDTGEDDKGGGDAGKVITQESIEEDLNYSEEEEHLEQEEEAVLNDENEHDTEEQDEDGHNESSEQTEAEEADTAEDEELVVEEDLAEDVGEEGQQEAERQQDAGRHLEAGEPGEKEGEEKSSDKAETHVRTRAEDGAIQDGQEEEHKEGEGVEKEHGDHSEMREDRGNVEQQVTASHRNGAWMSWDVADVNGTAEGEGGTMPGGEEERTVEDENGRAEETRKRASACSTPEERPNKRNKTDRGENEDGAATRESLSRTDGLKTRPRPRTPLLQSTTPSSPNILCQIFFNHEFFIFRRICLLCLSLF